MFAKRVWSEEIILGHTASMGEIEQWQFYCTVASDFEVP